MAQENCPAKNHPEVENLFSAWDEPEDRNSSFQCNKKIVDLPYIVNYLKLFIEDMFTHPEYFDPASASLLSTVTPYVTVMGDLGAQNTGKLPAVVIDFAGAEIKQDFGFDAEIGYNLHKSTGTYLARWTSGYTINVMARNRYETFLLGTSLARCLLSAKTLFKKNLNLMTCQVASVGKATPRSEADSGLGFVLPITLSMTSDEVWNVIEIAPVLKKVVAVTNL